jgi:hypothetical protein
MIASRPCISTRRLSSSWEISLVKMRWPNEKRGGSRHSAWRRSEQTQRNPIVDGSIIRCVTATSVSSGTGAERAGTERSTSLSLPYYAVAPVQCLCVWRATGVGMAHGTAENWAPKGTTTTALLLPLLTPGGILSGVLPSWNCTIGLEQAGIRIFGTHFGATVQSTL